eukprot:1141682-Pelagomonas_calceolata.AAC.8
MSSDPGGPTPHAVAPLPPAAAAAAAATAAAAALHACLEDPGRCFTTGTRLRGICLIPWSHPCTLHAPFLVPGLTYANT